MTSSQILWTVWRKYIIPDEYRTHLGIRDLHDIQSPPQNHSSMSERHKSHMIVLRTKTTEQKEPKSPNRDRLHLPPRFITPDLHNSFSRPLTHDSTCILPINSFPNALAWLRQLPHVAACPGLEQPHTPIVATRHQEIFVKLERGDRRVMRGNALNGGERGEGKRDYAAIGATCG